VFCFIVFKGQWCTRESACAPFQNLITEITNQENVDVRSSRITTSSKGSFIINSARGKAVTSSSIFFAIKI
jgi:hypothetical protein